MKSLKVRLLALAAALCFAGVATAQLIYGNTFPFWVVNGPLTVTGVTTLSGANTLSGATTISGALTTTSTAVLKGTTTNDSAAAGNIGELLTSTVALGSAVATTTATPVNVTSVSLTAGDWDVSFTCNKGLTGVTATIYSCGLGTTTATQLTQAGGGGVGTDPLSIQAETHGTTITGTYSQTGGPVRVTLAATTTIFLVASDTFSAGTLTNYGTLRARRMR